MRASPIGDFPRGFTLIELLIVITIIAVLASIAIPVFNGVQERAKATQDMNNLRQIGLATQLYLNDNDGVIFSTDASAGPWMTQLHPKYLAAWKIFQSPFDNRSPAENNTAPISYGLNGNPGGGAQGIAGLPMDRIMNPSTFILFAPAQATGASVSFLGTPAAAVLVFKDSVPAAAGGTHSSRKRINALFADLHSEAMPWNVFKNDSVTSADPNAPFRWNPYTPYP